MDQPWYWVADPTLNQTVAAHFEANGFTLADKVLLGNVPAFKHSALGVDILISNSALTWTGNINIATNPSNTDTVVIDGVPFTFVSSTSRGYV